MKKALIIFIAMLALSACKNRSAGNSTTSSGSADTTQGSSGGGGAGNVPAKSNLDTTNDSTHTPGHIDSTGKKK